MKDGAVVAELTAADADVDDAAPAHGRAEPAGRLLSRALQKPFQPRVLLEAEGLCLGKAYRDVSFKLRAGEILGIAGVIGSGREELTRTLAGFAPHDGGRLKIAATARSRWRRPPRRSISASAMFRANGASKALCCSSRFRRTSRWRISRSLTRCGLIDAARGTAARGDIGSTG